MSTDPRPSCAPRALVECEIVLIRRISLAGEPSMVSAMHSLSLVRRGMLLEGLDVLAGHAGKPLRTPAPTKVNHEKDAETVGNMWRYFIRHVSRCLRTTQLPAEGSK